MAKVFMLRELVGLEANEVCLETGLSDSNYWVTLHRARLRLRECLEIHWFNYSNQNQKRKNIMRSCRLSERLAIRLHVMVCSRCRNFQQQSQFIHKAAHQYTEQLQKRLDKK